ncbi:MAG: hypothetical protein ACTS6J_20230 [Burkholderiales bacterium]
MKFRSAIAVLITAIALAGCASTTIGLRSTNAPSMRGGAPVAGSSYSSAAIHAEVNSNAYFALFFLGFIAAGVQENYPSRSDGPAWRKPPQLAEDRAIAERDCSLPMAQPSANLRCK